MAKAKAVEVEEVVVPAPEPVVEEEVEDRNGEQFAAAPEDTHTFVTKRGVADPNKPRDEQ